MSSNVRIVRVKVQGDPLISLSKNSGGTDYFLTYPGVGQGEYRTESHSTFHTKTGRITFKTTRLRHKGVDVLPDFVKVLKSLRNKPGFKWWVGESDVDLFRGKILDLTDSSTVKPWFRIALNMEGVDLGDFFGATKTKDGDFGKVLDFRYPDLSGRKITIGFGVAKNYSGAPGSWARNVDEAHQIEDINSLGDRYTFFVTASYKFPKV